MAREPSRAIRDLRYDADRAVLFVVFVSGEAYAYFDVPPRTYGEFVAAESQGRYFHDHVLDRFRYERLGPVE